MIATVEIGQQLIGMLWVAYHSIEIDHGVEVSQSANPLIHCLPVSLAQRAGMIVSLTQHRA